MNAAEHKWMKGTEGNLDYIVFAEHDALQVGLKPVIEPALFDTEQGKVQGYLVGVRIRAAAKEGVKVLNAGFTAQNIFTTFQFVKVDENRASSFIGAAMPQFPKDFTGSQLVQSMEKGEFFVKVIQGLEPIVSVADSTEEPALLESFMKEKMIELVDSYVKYGSVTLKAPEKQGKLIPFPSPKSE